MPARPTHWIGAEALPEQRDGGDDRDRRPERRRETDEPRLGVLEAVGERRQADDVEDAGQDDEADHARVGPTRAAIARDALDHRRGQTPEHGRGKDQHDHGKHARSPCATR